MKFWKCDRNDERWIQAITKTFRNIEIDSAKARAFLQDDHIWIYVAAEADHVCGYVLAYVLPRMDCDEDMLTIYHCFVDPSYQRRHVAQTLMQMVLNDAEAHHMYYTFLITQQDNIPANRLYQKLGGQLHERNNCVYYWYGKGKPKV